MKNNEFELDSSLPPKIPPGKYEVMMKNYYTALMFGGKAPKLILDFVVVGHCKEYGKVIPKYYNVLNLIGRPQKRGRFKVGKKSDFARDFFDFIHCGTKRMDRLCVSHFEGVTFLAEVVTVAYARNRKITEPLQYSKIGRLLKVIERR